MAPSGKETEIKRQHEKKRNNYGDDKAAKCRCRSKSEAANHAGLVFVFFS